MQLDQHTPFHKPRAGSLFQFLITLCILIWNINQTFTTLDPFSFHAVSSLVFMKQASVSAGALNKEDVCLFTIKAY